MRAWRWLNSVLRSRKFPLRCVRDKATVLKCSSVWFSGYWTDHLLAFINCMRKWVSPWSYPRLWWSPVLLTLFCCPSHRCLLCVHTTLPLSCVHIRCTRSWLHSLISSKHVPCLEHILPISVRPVHPRAPSFKSSVPPWFLCICIDFRLHIREACICVF